MPLLFSYGTLQQDDVQQSTFGRSLQGETDALQRYETGTVTIDGVQYANAKFNGNADSRIAGMVFEVTEAELARADAYEGPSDYRRLIVELASGKQAWVYVSDNVPPAMADELARAQALRNLGESQRELPGDGGVAAYREAIAILRQHNVPLRLAHAVRHLGDIYRHAGDFDQAGACYDEALTLYRVHADARPLDVANALRGAALLKEKTGDPATAIRYWEEARNIYEAANVEAGATEGARRILNLKAALKS
jgi:tetratricopeptide (TPR) repeat protein